MILSIMTLGSIFIPFFTSSWFARISKFVKISLYFERKSRSSMLFIPILVFYAKDCLVLQGISGGSCDGEIFPLYLSLSPYVLTNLPW